MDYGQFDLRKMYSRRAIAVLQPFFLITMRWTEAGKPLYTHVLWLCQNTFKHFESMAARSTFPVIRARHNQQTVDDAI